MAANRASNWRPLRVVLAARSEMSSGRLGRTLLTRDGICPFSKFGVQCRALRTGSLLPGYANHDRHRASPSAHEAVRPVPLPTSSARET